MLNVQHLLAHWFLVDDIIRTSGTFAIFINFIKLSKSIRLYGWKVRSAMVVHEMVGGGVGGEGLVN